MKSNMITIIKKEFARFFLDKRMVITTLIVPGLLIYVLYSLMGQGLMNKFSTEKDYKAKVYIQNMPESLQAGMAQLPVEIQKGKEKLESMKKDIQEKNSDLLIIFPEDFQQKVESYDPKSTDQAQAPNVQLFYNSTATHSQFAFETVNDFLTKYETSLANVFDVNQGDTIYDVATKEDNTAQVFANMLPMLMMIFLFSGCMGIVPEAIAGEKERGTIATLLVTPMKRSQLALGKIISLGVISLLSGISSFAGTMLSIPRLMGGAVSEVNAAVYGPKDYVLLLLLILTTVLVISSAISIISAFSKSVKEASTAVMPLMVVVMLVGISSMLSEGATKDLLYYCIPLYNSVQAMSGIFSFDYELSYVLMALATNLVFTGILAFVLTKLFNNEKVMFSK